MTYNTPQFPNSADEPQQYGYDASGSDGAMYHAPSQYGATPGYSADQGAGYGQQGYQAGYEQPGYQVGNYQQPGYQQPGYQPGYQQSPYGYPQAQQSKWMSITSLIIGIGGILWGGLIIFNIAGLIFGFMGLKNEPDQKGLAITGIVLNGIFVLLGLIGVIMLFSAGFWLLNPATWY